MSDETLPQEEVPGCWLRVTYGNSRNHKDFLDRITYDADMILNLLPVLDRTPKGVWLKTEHEDRRWVAYGQGKRYAHPTLEGAIRAFYARKEREIRFLTHKIGHIQAAMEKANKPSEQLKLRRVIDHVNTGLRWRLEHGGKPGFDHAAQYGPMEEP